MKLEEKIKNKYLYKKKLIYIKIIYFFYQYIKSMKFLKKRIFYSNWGVDKIAEDFFKQRKAGFFVDVGCHQPFLNNNTYVNSMKDIIYKIYSEPLISGVDSLY